MTDPNKFEETIRYYLEEDRRVIDKINKNDIRLYLNRLYDARTKKKSIYFIGNGGSCSTSEHFVEDLDKFAKIKAYSLTNSSAITMIGNDYGYDQVFKKQLETRLEKDDVLVAISGSGNSLNILKALEYAREKEAVTIGLLGFAGGIAKELCDHYIIVPTTHYGILEDFHLTLCHIACQALKSE